MSEVARKPIGRFLPLAVFAALVAFFVVGLVWNQTHDARFVPSPLINKAAPDYRLPRLNDPTQFVTKADMLGKPLPLENPQLLGKAV